MGKERWTTEKFIIEATAIHGDRYRYEKVNYINSYTKVEIICKEHGSFWQLPMNHIHSKSNCLKCKYEQLSETSRKKSEAFIKQVEIIHNFYYDYSLTNYETNKTKVKIICPVHGILEQIASDHLSGRGCKECGFIKRTKVNTKTKENFIVDAIQVHGNKYDYSSFDYRGNKVKSTIICSEHGGFMQTPDCHLRGYGCKECWLENSTGWGETSYVKNCKDGYSHLYAVLITDDDEEFIKIGVSKQSLDKRFVALPYSWECLYYIKLPVLNILKTERSIQKQLRQFKYKPKIKFNGYTECFTLESLNTINEILKE